MNSASSLNKLIELASQRGTATGHQSFETASPAELAQTLKAANLFFTCSVLGMEAISHVIEEQAYNFGGKFRFYSAFQKFSRFRPQTARYRNLTSLGNPIYIFGIPDAPLPTNPNLHPIYLTKPASLEEEHLAHNWFVVLDSPDFVSMALVARELPGNPRPGRTSTKLIYRNFEGFWTYDKATIVQVVNILEDYKEHHKPAASAD